MEANAPPQNISTEASVLGALLVSEAACADVEQVGLAPEDFYLDKHALLYRCIVALRSKSKPVDELTVTAALERDKKLEEAGGRHYVSELAAKVPAAGNARHYAEIVKVCATDRQRRQIGHGLLDGLGTAEAIERLRALEIRAGGDSAWLGSAATLLAKPDPGPTPFLVDRLLVDGAIGALVGSYKLGKTWLAIDIAISVATGRPLFGELEVKQGPAIVVLEESGERALHRRLGMLTRGRAIGGEELDGLHYAANRRVRFDDPSWRARLLAVAQEVRPALIVLDPLVRLKGGADENSQAEMAPVLDYIRELRDASGGAVLFTHHTGHDNRGRMRGTADLEGYWESKLVLSAEEGSPVATLAAEHREAESGGKLEYRRVGDDATDSLRLLLIEREDQGEGRLEELVSAIKFKPGRSTTELAKAVQKRRSDTASRLKSLEDAGTAFRAPSQITDGAGRVRTIDGWFLAAESDSHPVPIDGIDPDVVAPDEPDRPAVPALIGPDGDGVASRSGPEESAGPDGPPTSKRATR